MGDGRFQWYWAVGSDPESYQGPCETRDEAICEAKADALDTDQEGFTICEADKAVASPDIFDAGRVFEDYEEKNEECWGEDGADIEATAAQKFDLEAMLAATLNAWFEKHGTKPRPWRFDKQRNEEYIEPVKTLTA